MNTMTDPLSRKEVVKAAIPTRSLRAARKQDAAAITQDPRWKHLKAIDKRHMMQLLMFHNPLNGHLMFRTKAETLASRLFVTEETLRTSRWRLIETGLIVSYVPGSGRRASEYVIARSWDEAEEAAAKRRQPEAPHWPELVTTAPSAPGKRVTPAPAGNVEGQEEREETPQERAEAADRLERARRRRGVRGPVPPELPSSWEMTELRETTERWADPDRQRETNDRGRAAARAAIRRAHSTSGAA